MPNLLLLCKDPKFLTTEFYEVHLPAVDRVASIVSSLIKMVKQDFVKERTSPEEFEGSIAIIQSKVGEI